MRRNLIIAKVLVVLIFSTISGFGMGALMKTALQDEVPGAQAEDNSPHFDAEEKKLVVPVMVVGSVIFFTGMFAVYELLSIGVALLLDQIIPESSAADSRPPMDRSTGLG